MPMHKVNDSPGVSQHSLLPTCATGGRPEVLSDPQPLFIGEEAQLSPGPEVLLLMWFAHNYSVLSERTHAQQFALLLFHPSGRCKEGASSWGG